MLVSEDIGDDASAGCRLHLRQLRALGAGEKFSVSLSVDLLDDGDVHHAEVALHLALLALQLVASSLGSRSCGNEEEDRTTTAAPGAATGVTGV